MSVIHKVSYMVVSFVLCALSAGCGRTDESSAQTEPPAQWKTQGFAISQSDAENRELNIKEYLPWEHGEVYNAEEGESRRLVDSGSWEDMIWMLSEICAQNRFKEWALEIYDVSAGEYTVKKFSHEQLGLKGGILSGMEMIDRDHYVFQQAEWEYNDQNMSRRTADRWIYTDLVGDAHIVDLLPVYLEKGLAQDEFTQGSYPLYGVGCDGRGNLCMLGSLDQRGYRSVHFFDREGNMVLEHRVNGSSQTVQEPLRTWDGELIIPVLDSQTRQVEYFWADTEGGEMRSMAVETRSSGGIYRMYGMQGNDIYYNRANKEIIKWNIVSGERTVILNLPKNGIAVNLNILLAPGREDYPTLCLIDQSNKLDWLAPLTDQEVTDRETVRIVDLVKSNRSESMVSDSVSLSANTNRSIDHKYEKNTSEEFRTRLLADLSSGKGPDLMYVSLEDMRMLEEKGALLDLRELLPEGLLEEILPAALEIGTVDGKLVGLPTGLQGELWMVSRDVWSGDSWRLEDVIRLMENGELEGGVYYVNDYFWPLAAVKLLIQNNLHDSFLIDWENRECHFDDERFIRLLELTRTNLNDDFAETDSRLNGGKRMAYAGFSSYSVNDFDVERELENGNYVGCPTESGCGNYLFAEGVIVVNAATEHTEAVRSYLKVLFSDEIQWSQIEAFGVCGVSPERGYTDPETGKLMWYNKEEVAVFSDNTTALDRTNAYLRSCVAVPPQYPLLMEIISEELEIMYEENRTPKDAAEVIKNRVQVYLDEGE